MTFFKPTPRELNALSSAETSLANLGIHPGSQGYDLNVLAIAIYDLGGAYSIDQSSGSYTAEIRPQQSLVREPSGDGVGWTPESALTFALLQVIAKRRPKLYPRRAAQP